jgi:hypothetical protein
VSGTDAPFILLATKAGSDRPDPGIDSRLFMYPYLILKSIALRYCLVKCDFYVAYEVRWSILAGTQWIERTRPFHRRAVGAGPRQSRRRPPDRNYSSVASPRRWASATGEDGPV